MNQDDVFGFGHETKDDSQGGSRLLNNLTRIGHCLASRAFGGCAEGTTRQPPPGAPALSSPRGSQLGLENWKRSVNWKAAMCRTFAELDYTPLVECGRVPAMVTLTYPGEWQSVAHDGASVKRHMVLWRKRFQREWGEPADYIWKLEFQRRGAPHIHLWMAPHMLSAGRAASSKTGYRRSEPTSLTIPTPSNGHVTCRPARPSTS